MVRVCISAVRSAYKQFNPSLLACRATDRDFVLGEVSTVVRRFGCECEQSAACGKEHRPSDASTLSLPAIREEHVPCRDACSVSRREHDPVSGSRDLCSLSLSAWTNYTTVAVECRKGRDHIGSHVKVSFQGAKKLDTIMGGHNVHAGHEVSMSARVVEREQSMTLSAWHLRDNSRMATVLIEGHLMWLGTSLVRVM